MRPKRRFAVLYWLPVAALTVAGYVLDRRATAMRVANVEESLVSVSRTLDDLAKQIDELGQSMQNRGAVERLSAVGNEPPQGGGESVGGYPSRLVCRPRILGSGRTGRYLYTDVRHVDGQVLRYYIAEDASPIEVRAFVRSMAEDAQDRRFSVLASAD